MLLPNVKAPRLTQQVTNIFRGVNRGLEIPEGECVTRLGYREEYILAEYWGYRGYLPTDALVQD
jgi:hypothetical protein